MCGCLVFHLIEHSAERPLLHRRASKKQARLCGVWREVGRWLGEAWLQP